MHFNRKEKDFINEVIEYLKAQEYGYCPAPTPPCHKRFDRTWQLTTTSIWVTWSDDCKSTTDIV